MTELTAREKKQIAETLKQVNNRVTKRELSINTGWSLLEAERVLLKLAELTAARLEVTNQGEMIYNFPNNWQQRLQQKKNQQWLEQFIDLTKNLVLFSIRATISLIFLGSLSIALITAMFGLYLLIYILLRLVISLPLIFLSGTFDIDLDLGAAGDFFGDFFASGIVSGVFQCLVDSLAWEYQGMSKPSFFAVFFSFLFGDGQKVDPEILRWQAIAHLIVANQGAIIAEQIAPYLTLKTKLPSVEEDYIIPVLNQFNGFPRVSSQGDLIYHFPDLQVGLEQKLDREKNVNKFSYFQQPLYQYSRFKTNKIKYLLIINQLIWLLLTWGQILPAGHFVLLFNSILIILPLCRWLNLKIRNQQITRQNKKRYHLALKLSNQWQQFTEKLTARKKLAKFSNLGDDDIFYRS